MTDDGPVCPGSIEEQRQQLILEREEKVRAAKQKGDPKAVEDAARMFSAGERLRRRQEKTVLVTYRDDMGEFTFPVRIPSRKILKEIALLENKSMAPGITMEEKQALDERYSRIMADEICADPSMDMEFWMSEEYPLGLPLFIIDAVTGAIDEEAEAAAGFRKDKRRQGTRIPVRP